MIPGCIASLVALLGVQVQVNAPVHAQLWDDHQHASLGQLQSARVWAPTIVRVTDQLAHTYWQWAQGSPAPPGDSHRGATAVLVDSHCPSCGGKIQVPRGVCGTQVPGAPAQGAPVLVAPHGWYGAGEAPPGPMNPPP